MTRRTAITILAIQNKKLIRPMPALLLNDVILGIKEKEKHDEIVEKVMKQLAKNDLHVKPENISRTLEK